MKKTERQGGAERRQGKAGGASAGEKRTERQPEKSRRSVGREKQANSRQRKAGGASAGKASGASAGKASGVSAREKRRSVGRRKADKPSARKQAAEAKKAAGCFLRLFSISGQRAERPAISRSARYSRRRHASPAVWWRRPFHGRPPSAARPFRRRRSP